MSAGIIYGLPSGWAKSVEGFLANNWLDLDNTG